MAIVEVTVVPIGTPSTSISAYVAGCLKILQRAEGVKYQLTPMGTIIEGDLDRVLSLVRKMHEAPFAAGAGRVTTTVRIDDRRDKDITMVGKVSAVEARLSGPA